MVTIVFIELFGSVFMRSCSFAIAVLFGYMIAAFTEDSEGNSYTNRDAISEAPPILFLWVKTFPIGFYGPGKEKRNYCPIFLRIFN
jgi:NCS2 family nucleobase:cation symporter-2